MANKVWVVAYSVGDLSLEALRRHKGSPEESFIVIGEARWSRSLLPKECTQFGNFEVVRAQDKPYNNRFTWR